MLAAGFAGQNKSKVLLIEKNHSLGKKLLLTGKGRCNITNAETDIKEFAAAFGKKGKFLFSALNAFGVSDTINFFEQRGLKTKVERGNRVFPASDNAADVLNVLANFLKQSNVQVLLNSPIKAIVKKGNKIEKIVLKDKEIFADKFILATGGLSYPGTGSSGEGMSWAKDLGHTVEDIQPALTPLKIKEKWVGELAGLSLKNVSICVYQNNKKQDERFGEALFTHEGISGPIVLDMSKKIGDLLKTGPVFLRIDFKPALDFLTLDKRVQRDFKEMHNAMFKNSLDKLLPKKLIPVIVRLSKIDPCKKANRITSQERNVLLHLLKEMPMEVEGLLGFDKAIVTSGGISLSEIDPRTMQSKIIPNLYFAGEMIDLDGPTGGYNLQACWSTGYLAGASSVA